MKEQQQQQQDGGRGRGTSTNDDLQRGVKYIIIINNERVSSSPTTDKHSVSGGSLLF